MEKKNGPDYGVNAKRVLMTIVMTPFFREEGVGPGEKGGE
jgi:hypothetical protein